MIVPKYNIYLRAFGTHNNNRVEDITKRVRWEVADKDVLMSNGLGEFIGESLGITEVTAVSLPDSLKSLSAKIIVSEKQKETASTLEPEENKINPKNTKNDTRDDIKNELEKLRKEFAAEGKVLKTIKVSPDSLEIPVGETSQFTASGIYSDNSRADLTHLGDWSSSNDMIAAVSKGKINPVSPGEANIYVKYNGIKSLPAFVKVQGPKLVSIVLSPQSLRISMEESPFLKAEGYFSDSSRKDITSLVNWKEARSGTIKIEKGRVIPQRFGKTQVHAEYLGIQSLPCDITVVFTMAWLIHFVIKLLLLFILYILAVFVVSYALTEKIKNDLKTSLDTDPRGFIIKLYDNTRKILTIFQLPYKEPITPLSYARLIQESYSLEDSPLVNLTVKFEEARYSSHILTKEDAVLALEKYNNFLKTLFSRHSKATLFIKYCRSILHRTPLIITIP
jgi:hypothetical protein